MAHFARIEDGTVTDVIVVSDDDCAGGEFPESEQVGQAFIASLGISGQWLQTSYNTGYEYEFHYDENDPTKFIGATVIGSYHTKGKTPLRGKFATIGDKYDSVADKFVTPSA